MSDVLNCEGLCVSYDQRLPVVQALDLSLPRGSVCGLIGRNGAGKSSALRAMLGLLAPSAGRVRLLGEDSRNLSKAARRRIGYLSEDEFPIDDVPVLDLLRFLSGFHDEWDWDWCQHLAGHLRVDKDARLYHLSKGQRRIAELLLAVAHKPELLVLDDPALGLDAGVRRDLCWTLLEMVQEQGTTVLFSSHIIQDVAQVVDRVAILHEGRLRLQGELDEVIERYRRLILPAAEAPEFLPGELSRTQVGTELQLVTDSFEPGMLERYPVRESSRIDLEDIFLSCTEQQEVGT